MVEEGKLERLPLTQSVAAVSCGMVDGRALLDLDYSEDSTAEVDANVVMTGDGGLVEVQATAERTPLSRASLDELLALAEAGHRPAARGAGRGRRRAASPEASRTCELVARHPQRAQARASFAQPAARAHELVPLPDDVELPPETGDTFADNALIKARRRRARPPACPRSPTTPASRPRRSAARPASTRRATPGSGATDEANLDKLLREVPPDGDRAPSLRLRARLRPGPRRGAGASSRAAAPALLTDRPARRRRLRLRPGVRPDDRDDGRTMAELDAGREGRDQPPRPRRARVPRLARRAGAGRVIRRAGRSSSPPPTTRAARRAPPRLSIVSNSVLIVLKLGRGRVTGSIALITEAIHSSDRPDRVDRRLLLGPQGRPARRRVPPLRPREDREPRRRARGRADPARRRGHHLRVGRAGSATRPSSSRSASASP